MHRDLKPANILVSDDGIPKLLDFGVAKLLQSPLRPQHGATTLFGHQAFTPDYASPEQIRGDGLTTASDVYSLGVLSFELLVGRKPYKLTSATPSQLQAAVGTLVVPKASGAWQTDSRQSTDNLGLTALANLRSSTPAKIKRLLVGDLDTILAKAMHSEAERRYTSAAMLTEDLQNFRKGRPVAAQGDSVRYRVVRFLSTHRLGAFATLAVVASLAIGLTLSLWQANIAQQRFEDLHGLSQVLMSDIYDSVADLPGSTKARNLIATEAQHYLDGLAKGARGDAKLGVDLAMAYKRLGDVQGLPSNSNMGQSEQALENYFNALHIADALDSTDTTVIGIKALVREKIADVLAWRGDIVGSLKAGAESHQGYQSLYAQQPSEINLRRLALSHLKQGDTQGHPSFPNGEDRDAATASYHLALEKLTSVEDLPNAGWQLRRTIALVQERLGTMALLRNKTELALHHYQESKLARERLAQELPQHLDIVRDHGVALEKIADVQLRGGDNTIAVATFTEALAVYQSLAEKDPEDAYLIRTLAYGYENLAEAEVAAGLLPLAAEHYAQALALRERLVEIDPGAAHLATELQRTRTAAQNLVVTD